MQTLINFSTQDEDMRIPYHVFRGVRVVRCGYGTVDVNAMQALATGTGLAAFPNLDWPVGKYPTGKSRSWIKSNVP